MSTPIDVWNTDTFDQELMAPLRASEQLVRDYLTIDRRLLEEREASDHRAALSSNPYAGQYLAVVEEIGQVMQSRINIGNRNPGGLANSG